MAIINQSNILNLQPGITAPVVVHMSEGDSGTKLSFKLIDGARAWTDPGNVVAAVHGRRQDGTQFGPYACTISGDVVSFQTDAAIAAVAGSGIAQIVLTDSDQNTAGTANFAIMVERATFPMGVTYTNDKSVYEAILAYVQTIPAAVTEDYTTKIEAEAAAREAADASLQGQISAEASARSTQDAVLSARMDEFTKLPNGSISTAADAELVDIRVKADGTKASTAGNAVREQITELKNELSLIPFTLTEGAYVQSNNVLQEHSGYCYSSYIQVNPGDKIHVKLHFHDNPRAVFVNERKGSVIQAIANTGATTLYDEVLIVPANAKYFRFSCLKTKKDESVIEYLVNEKLYDANVQLVEYDARIEQNHNAIGSVPFEFIDGAFVNFNNLTIDSASYSYTSYVPVIEGTNIRIQTNFYDDARIVFADQFKNKVQAVKNSGSYPEYDNILEVPSGAAYVRFSCKTANKNEAKLLYIVNETLSKQISRNESQIELTGFQQGNENDRNNKNRVVLFIGAKDGTVNVTIKSGYQYYVEEYDSPFYDNKISSTGFKQISARYNVVKTLYTVIVFSRTNYAALSPADIVNAGVSVVFYGQTNEFVKSTAEEIQKASIIQSQNGLTEQLIVPRIYDDTNYIGGKIEQINNEVKKVFGSGDAFVFITDLHWKLNRKHSMSLLNRIYSLTHIDKLFVGGDISDSKNSDDSYFEVGSIIRNSWPGKTYYVMGNHEYLGSGSDGITTDDNLAYDFGAYYGNEVVYGNKKRNYYYVDNGGSKIRYIFLNRYAESVDNGQSSSEGLEEAQLNWFENVALNVENGWSVIIVLHSVFGYNIVEDNVISPFISTGSQGLVRIIENYNGQGEIIAIITGHAHLDAVFRLSNNIPVIVTTCDKNKSGGGRPFDPDYWTNRADGTLNEQAFDVMVVDKEARKITAVRIGCPATTWTEAGTNLIRGSDVEERVITF